MLTCRAQKRLLDRLTDATKNTEKVFCHFKKKIFGMLCDLL